MSESSGPDFWAPAGRAASRPARPEIVDDEEPADEIHERDEAPFAPAGASVAAGRPGLSEDQRTTLIGALDALLECRRLLAGRN